MDFTPLPSDQDALRRSLDATDLPASVISRLLEQARPALVLATTAREEDAIPWAPARSAGARTCRVAWPGRRGRPIQTRMGAPPAIARRPSACWRIRRKKDRG